VPLTVPLVVEHTESAHESDEDAGAAAKSPPVLGVVACLLAGGALLAASMYSTTVLTRPLAALGLVLGFISALSVGGKKPIRLVLPIGGAVASAAVLIMAFFAPGLLGPHYEASRATTDYDQDAIRVVPVQLSGGIDGLETDGYADASRAAVQQGTFRVRIVSASVGPVQVVDSKKRYTKQQFLAVTVQIQHLEPGDRARFVHWGTTGERAVPDAVATANGQKLSLANLERDVPVGVSYGQDIFPGRSVSDLLLFEPPAPGSSVRLDLPAEAWGGQGVFRFQIPSSMMMAQPPGKFPR
jgi:hypothetical protein